MPALHRLRAAAMPGRDEALAALNAALDELICSSVAAESVGSKDDNGVIAHALHTLVVLLSTQLKHPADARYHRLNTQNANLRRVIALPGEWEPMPRGAGVRGRAVSAWQCDAPPVGPPRTGTARYVLAPLRRPCPPRTDRFRASATARSARPATECGRGAYRISISNRRRTTSPGPGANSERLSVSGLRAFRIYACTVGRAPARPRAVRTGDPQPHSRSATLRETHSV